MLYFAFISAMLVSWISICDYGLSMYSLSTQGYSPFGICFLRPIFHVRFEHVRIFDNDQCHYWLVNQWWKLRRRLVMWAFLILFLVSRFELSLIGLSHNEFHSAQFANTWGLHLHVTMLHVRVRSIRGKNIGVATAIAYEWFQQSRDHLRSRVLKNQTRIPLLIILENISPHHCIVALLHSWINWRMIYSATDSSSSLALAEECPRLWWYVMSHISLDLNFWYPSEIQPKFV